MTWNTRNFTSSGKRPSVVSVPWITIKRKTTRNDSVRMQRNLSIAIHGLLGGATSLNAKTRQRGNVLAGVSDFCPCLHSTHRINPRSKTTFLQKSIYKFDTPPNDDGFYAISPTQCLVDVAKYWHIFADVATVASGRLGLLASLNLIGLKFIHRSFIQKSNQSPSSPSSLPCPPVDIAGF